MSPHDDQFAHPVRYTPTIPESPARTPRDRWGTCCPSDPECDHSFLEIDDLWRWMDAPISDELAKELESYVG